MFAVPKSESQWRAINLAGAAILLVIAVLPVPVLPLWKKPRVRPIVLGLCWLLQPSALAGALVVDRHCCSGDRRADVHRLAGRIGRNRQDHHRLRFSRRVSLVSRPAEL
jgi:hypothetical protein